MRKFMHSTVLRISNFKLSDHFKIGFAPNETKWKFKMVTIRTMKWALELDRKYEVMVNVSSILTTSTTNKIRLSSDNIIN